MIRLRIFLNKIRDIGNKKVQIKDSTIDNIKLIKIEDLSDEENLLIQQAHKLILKLSKEENDCNEVMIFVDLTDKKLSKPIFGSEDETLFTDDFIDDDNKDFGLCHNHPKGGDFSFEDVNSFLHNRRIKLMTAITNNGKVRYLYKGRKFTTVPLMKETRKIKNKIFKTVEDKEKFMDIFYKNLYYMNIKRRK